MSEKNKKHDKEGSKQKKREKSDDKPVKQKELNSRMLEAITDKEEMLENLPPEVKRIIQLTSSSYSGPFPSSNLPELNEKHIDKLLDISEKDDERRYKDAQRSRFFGLAYILIGVSVFIFLTLYLHGKTPDLYKLIIELFIVLAGGIGIGYGYKNKKEKN
jgi:hypothetical protein